MPEIKVEKLSEATVNDLTELIWEFQNDHADLYGTYYKLKSGAKAKIGEILGTLVRKRLTRVFLVFVDGKPTGYLFLDIKKNIPIYAVETYGYISGIYVRPQYRKLHLASKLLAEGEAWFRAMKIHRIELKVDLGNSIGQKLWAKAGYKPQQIITFKDS